MLHYSGRSYPAEEIEFLEFLWI